MNIKKIIQVDPSGLTRVKDVVISSYRLFITAFGALFVLTAPIAAYASNGSGIGSGRLLPSIAMIVGLAGVVIGRKSLINIRRSSSGLSGAIISIIMGLISLGIGALHAANAAGGFGTGNGLAGAIVALALGMAAIILGGLAINHSRREANRSNSPS